MSSKDLDSILPASNADKSDDDYDYYSDDYSDDDDEKETSKAAKKAKKHINKTKSKSIKDVSPKQKIQTKRPKGPSRSISVGEDKNMGPLQTTDPAAHALEAPKPMFVKQAIDNQFNKTHKIDISRATQLGIKKEGYDPDPVKEMYDEIEANKWYKQKKWIITMSVIAGVLILLAIGFAVYYFTKRRVLSQVDPLTSPITGGNNNSSSTDDKEKNINYITSPALNKDKNPPSFYDDYDNKSEKDEEIAEKAVSDVPKGKNSSKNSSPKPVAKKESKPVRELPKRGKDGKFISSKK